MKITTKYYFLTLQISVKPIFWGKCFFKCFAKFEKCSSKIQRGMTQNAQKNVSYFWGQNGHKVSSDNICKHISN